MPARSFNPAIAALREQIAAMEGDGGPAREVLPFGVPELDRRLPGQVLWCVTQADLLAAGLVQAGLGPDRVIYVEAGEDISVLTCMEEGLRHSGLGAVVADVGAFVDDRLAPAASGGGKGTGHHRHRAPPLAQAG